MEGNRLISVAATGESLGVSKFFVRVLIRRGDLRHVRIGRRVLIPVEEIERLIQRCTVKGGEVGSEAGTCCTK